MHLQWFNSSLSLKSQFFILYTAMKNLEAASAHRWKTAQEHVEDILSTSTIDIPSNHVIVSHQILGAVATYARDLELEETVAGLRQELSRRSLLSTSPRSDLGTLSSPRDDESVAAFIPSTYNRTQSEVRISGKFQRSGLNIFGDDTPHVVANEENLLPPNISEVRENPSDAHLIAASSRSQGQQHLIIYDPFHREHREVNLNNMQYQRHSHSDESTYGYRQPAFYPAEPAIGDVHQSTHFLDILLILGVQLHIQLFLPNMM
ncbi:hypothetical protein C8J57DRAFT_1212620 [Mycena rebaudengoi]|jgi:hypothetical protein|nr:hypothetical protein C8J57DRAFT_1212620 [Mycena rebaudengoi]